MLYGSKLFYLYNYGGNHCKLNDDKAFFSGLVEYEWP